jgi:hypothetical protein
MTDPYPDETNRPPPALRPPRRKRSTECKSQLHFWPYASGAQLDAAQLPPAAAKKTQSTTNHGPTR